MRPRTVGLVSWVVVLVWTGLVVGYTRPRFAIGPEIKQSRWPTSAPVQVRVNLDPPNSIFPGSQPFQAVRNAFETRAAYSTISFALSQGSSPSDIGFDGTSLVTFKSTPANQSATAGFGAVTFFWFNVVGGEPVLTESDIAFSSVFFHTTVGGAGFDIEALAGHELTHFLSHEHSAVMASTGFPDFEQLDATKRSLALDDLAGTEFLYPFPDTQDRTGALSGTVLENGTNAVFGSQVVAVRELDGAVVSELSVFGGEWRIDALPPGDYRLYAEPFDGPYFPGLINDGIYSQPFDTSVVTTYAGGNAAPSVYSVTAGGEISGIAIEPPVTPVTLNARWIGRSPDATSPFAATFAVSVVQGDSAFVTIAGPGIDQVPDDGVSISGPGVHVSADDVFRGTVGSDPYMIVSVSVDADAPPVVRSIFVDDGTRIAAVSGGFEVLRAEPLPGLLRNDQLTGVAPFDPPLASLFLAGDPALDPTGADAFPGIGEGRFRESNGSDDDDDLYLVEVPSGYLDPDLKVATDAGRPLVFYELTDPDAVLRLDLSPAGRIQILY